MSERITRANLDERATNVNRRIASQNVFVTVQGRNGYLGLDLYQGHAVRPAMLRTLTCGTKREVGDYLTAMMVALDLVRA